MTCTEGCQQIKKQRRSGVLKILVHVLFVYVLLVFGGGTLIQTGHPVAVEAGELIHTVTLVDPMIHWAHDKGLDTIAGGLQTLSDGVDFRRWT
jgi:hypothetical protein